MRQCCFLLRLPLQAACQLLVMLCRLCLQMQWRLRWASVMATCRASSASPARRTAPGEPGWPVLGGVGRLARRDAGGMLCSAGESRMKHAARCSCRAGAPGPCLVRTEPTRPPHGRGRRPARAAPLRCAGSPCARCLPAWGWQLFLGAGGRAGRGTHGAASCCLRRSPVHACMAALQRGWVPSSGSAGGAYIPQSETCRWCDSCMVVSHQAMSWFGLSWVVVVLLDECAPWWR